MSDPAKAKGVMEGACRYLCSVWLRTLWEGSLPEWAAPTAAGPQERMEKRGEEAPYRRGLVREEGDMQAEAGQDTISLGHEGISTCISLALLLLTLPD